MVAGWWPAFFMLKFYAQDKRYNIIPIAILLTIVKKLSQGNKRDIIKEEIIEEEITQ
jgi:hypothetical protein